MTPSNLIKLIKACAESGVSRLKFENYEVEFGPNLEAAETLPSAPWPSDAETIPPDEEEIKKLQEAAETFEEENLPLMDPLEWQKRATDPERYSVDPATDGEEE